MILHERDLGKFVLNVATITIIGGVFHRLFSRVMEQGAYVIIPALIGVAITAGVLFALWKGRNWVRYLLGYGHFIGGIMGMLFVFLDESDSGNFGLLEILLHLWYALVGALLIWTPGIRGYMRELRD